MAEKVAIDNFTAVLRRVVADQYGEKPVFYWPDESARLRNLIGDFPSLNSVTQWIDVNELAEDVIPRRARETLRARVAARLEDAIVSDCRVLVVDNPYLLCRYEDSPLAMLWNRFVTSRRAVVVVLPPVVPRPADLPAYVRFEGDALRERFLAASDDVRLVTEDGGAEQW